MTTEQTISNDPQTTGEQPRKRGGAPTGNTNGLKHGRRSGRTRFSQWRGIRRSRPELADVESACEALLCQLEASLSQDKGEVSIEDASAADVAVGAQFVAMLAFRHIVSGGLAPDVELSFAKDALKAQATRHEFIVKLGLRRTSELNPWDQFHEQQRKTLATARQAELVDAKGGPA